MKGLLLSVIAFAALAASSCASAQAKAKSPVEHPPLDLPPVPARLIEPALLPPPPPEPVAEQPAPTTTAKPKPPARETARPAEPPKTETPPVEANPPAAPPATPPVPPLRTTATPDVAATRQVRDLIDRAQATLNGVDYTKLNRQRRSQYDNAKLLLKQAEEALKASNYEFSQNLADKADKIAKELAGK